MINPFLSGDSIVRSFNRARLVELRGIQVDPEILGKNGYELLSASALRLLLLAAQEELALEPTAPDLLRQFDRCFDYAATRPCAMQIARRYGRRLGYLLLMLQRGGAGNRQARPEWTDAHWEFWKGLRHVWLGGGMVAGALGQHAVAAALELLAENGAPRLDLVVSPHAAYLPLVGLARSAPQSAGAMLVFDFGQTSIKRGLASYGGGQLSTLDRLPPVPSVCEDIFQTEHTLEEAMARWQRMLVLMAESWDNARLSRPAAIGVSLSCYLIDGHPSSRDWSCYGSLRLLSPHLMSYMQAEIAARLGEPLPLVLRHDGTAAAAAYAGAEDTLVMTLGTAIGSGFPPPAIGQWPLAPDFCSWLSGEPKASEA
jgi:hypothetical protein